jgi:hypothetical protein
MAGNVVAADRFFVFPGIHVSGEGVKEIETLDSSQKGLGMNG